MRVLTITLFLMISCFAPVFAQQAADPVNTAVVSEEGTLDKASDNVMAQEPEQNAEDNMEETEQINDEGYGNTDEEYNGAEVNSEIPDEYFDDEPNAGNAAQEDNAAYENEDVKDEETANEEVPNTLP